MNTKVKTVIGVVLVTGLMAMSAVAFAKHGADDPAGHDRGDDHGGRRARTALVQHTRGSDDPITHDQNDDPGDR